MSALSLPLTALAMALLAGWCTALLVFPIWNAMCDRWPSLARSSMLVASLPLAASTALVLAAIIPGDPHLGTLFGCHCTTSMPGWIHLCPIHPSGASELLRPGLLAVAALLPTRLRIWRSLARHPLGRGHGEVAILDLPHPTALLVGWWRPSVVVDRRLWDDLSPLHREVVIAHERAHLSRRDPLTLMLLRGLVSLGPTKTGDTLVRGWLNHAERSADAGAAEVVGDRLHVAEALLRCANLGSPRLSLAWTGGQLEHRVAALLVAEARPTRARPDLSKIHGVLIVALGVVVLANTPWLHHQVEHLLNLSR